MLKRRLVCLTALLLTALAAWSFLHTPTREMPPLPAGEKRQLLRIWLVSSPGGGESWLRACLRQWEKQHPRTMTYLRSVTPVDASAPDAALPDIVLYMPGDFTSPQDVFTPLVIPGPVLEPLLRAGRWQDAQYGLPLCYAAYALAIDSTLEPGQAAFTPAPTTLLGRPAATVQPSSAPSPAYPLDAALQAELPLAAPRGAGLFTLCSLLPEARPPLPSPLSDPAGAYALFRQRQAATAILTTGQLTALEGLHHAGKAFPYRVMTPQEVITDQVWLASLTQGASAAAAELLAYLASPAAQKLLSQQGLYASHQAVKLYAAGTGDAIERAAARSLTAINAYVPAQDVQTSAWQVASGLIPLQEALLPLL